LTSIRRAPRVSAPCRWQLGGTSLWPA
jgi:hypothetical protein